MENKSITIFRNIKDTSTPFFRDITYILNRIKEGMSKELIKQIRAEKDKEVRQGLTYLLYVSLEYLTRGQMTASRNIVVIYV